MDFYIGQIFDNGYPPEAADWCDEHNCYLKDIDGNRIQITLIEVTPEDRRTNFLREFFEVENVGYYRRIPKGYQSAIESINTAFNICSQTGGLPADTLIFYPEPDFTIPEQCTEEWLVEHQIKLPAMNSEAFTQLYIAFVTAWNREEH